MTTPKKKRKLYSLEAWAVVDPSGTHETGLHLSRKSARADFRDMRDYWGVKTVLIRVLVREIP